MRYLLDTHVLAWAVGNPALLSGKVISILKDRKNQILFSPANIWEMSIKYHLGKWPEVKVFMDELVFLKMMQQLGATELLINQKHTRLAGLFTYEHKDPFDRLLAAQAILEGISLISKDMALDSFPVRRIWNT